MMAENHIFNKNIFRYVITDWEEFHFVLTSILTALVFNDKKIACNRVENGHFCSLYLVGTINKVKKKMKRVERLLKGKGLRMRIIDVDWMFQESCIKLCDTRQW